MPEILSDSKGHFGWVPTIQDHGDNPPLDRTFQTNSPEHELSIELHFLVRIINVSFQNDVM